MRRLRKIVIGLLTLFFAYQILVRIVRRFFHFPAPAFLGRFLNSPLRRCMQPPEQVIERSGIRENMHILEIGCGSGAFTLPAARAVGSLGSVAALDIQPAMLAQLARRLQRSEFADIHQVTLYEGSAYDLPFDDGSFDLVFMVTVLPEIPDQPRALAAIYRVLRPGGILAVSEFLFDPDYPLSSTTVRRGIDAGFQVQEVLGNLWTYTVRFTKPVD